ncbi:MULTISPECIES: urease accessory protein UreD [unclassified Sporosarcina]|uniref:urease accessory protein UreD n=1 Tax=unclassified Sporosarcina TaxID=2647733 RepID=UPI000C165D7B|nr:MULTISPECIES: urease accessory protein UreD [unclassified Sporosarcina]PID06117.1 urease accessory protein [Sporosarcina sp. P30]PID09311.1 urease accessory protein [Sporosarcina sp. P31]PID12610.1 urease accessory protein [Sporosarcina sp. P32b]
MSEWTGVLDLVMENRLGRSVAKTVYFQGAFKVMRPVYFNKNSYPCYYLLNPGGGYLDGDRYQMKVTLGEGAMLTLTTQSSTKVYRTPTKPVYQETIFRMKKDSYLEYLPDALIAYKDASCYQKNSIYMEKGATLLYSDILTPGWSPDGEKFSYDMLRLKTEIYMDDQLVAFDHIKLHPASQDMNALGFMEGYTHLGSLIVVGEKTSDALLDRLYEAIQREDGEFAFGLSKLAVPGFTIRILANYTQVIERIISVCHHIISDEWYQTKPSFLRKY